MLKGVVAAFSPRYDYLAVVGGDGALKVWSENGKCSGIDADVARDYSSLAWCRLLKQEGKKKKKLVLALGTKNGTVLTWDPVAEEIRWKITDLDLGAVHSMCFLQLHQLLYVAVDDGLLQEIDTHSGEVRENFRVAHTAVSVMTISADGRTLIVGAGSELRLFNLETKKKIRTLSSNFPAKALAFVVDGAHVLAASEESRLVVFGLQGSERVVSSLSLEHPAVAVDSWGHEGDEGTLVRLLAVTQAGEAYVWSEMRLERMAEAKPLRYDPGKESYIINGRFLDCHWLCIARGTTRGPVFEKVSLEGLTGTVLLGVAPLSTAGAASLEKPAKRKADVAEDYQPLNKQEGKPSKRARTVSFGGVTVIENNKEERQDEQHEENPEEPDEYRYKWFSKEEDEIIMQAAREAVKAAGWSLEDGLQRLLGMTECTSREEKMEKRNCWKSIISSIPYRKPRAVRARAVSVLDIFTKRGKWDAEESELFKRLMEKYGRDWHKIAKELGRDRRDVRYKWRYIRNQKRRGSWSLEETEKLCELVHENLALNKTLGEDNKRKQILGLNWTAIGNALGSRPDSTCMRKWYDILSSKQIRTRDWKPEDDHKLLLSLLESGVLDEEYIEWDQLVSHRSKDACKTRWQEMVHALGSKHKGKPFETKLEMLVKRYAPSILEDAGEQEGDGTGNNQLDSDEQ